MDRPLDITIIGAGVIGCAVARELSRYHLRVAVAEAHPDLFGGTSARNSGVIHAGFHNTPGSLMARLCVEGNRLFSDLTAHLDVPMRRTGKLVVGFDEEDRAHLLSMLERGRRNGVPGLTLIGRDELRRLAPAVAGEFALYSASTGIVDPFQWTWALAENAAQNGVRFLFSSPLTAAVRRDGLWALTVGNRTLYSRWVINCAGLFSDKVAALLGLTGYEIYPCRGEYFLLDERLSSLLPLPAYPVPNYRTGGLGIHLTPTLEGNILIGPSTEYIGGPTDWRTTALTQDMLLREGRRIFPSLSRSDCIRAFAGVRPKLTGPDRGGYDDFVICRREDVSPRVIDGRHAVVHIVPVLVGNLIVGDVQFEILSRLGLLHIANHFVKLVAALVEVLQRVQHHGRAVIVVGVVDGINFLVRHGKILLHGIFIGAEITQVVQHVDGNVIIGPHQALIVGVSQSGGANHSGRGDFSGGLHFIVVHIQRQLIGAGRNHKLGVVVTVLLTGNGIIVTEGKISLVQAILRLEVFHQGRQVLGGRLRLYSGSRYGPQGQTQQQRRQTAHRMFHGDSPFFSLAMVEKKYEQTMNE